MNPSIIVIGSINTDLVVRGARLPAPGETVIGGEFYQAQGGKGANQAVAAARASRDPVVLIGAVGDDAFGQTSRAALFRENLVCDFLRTVRGQSSGVALIMVDQEGQNLISVASGANRHLSPDDVDRVPDDLFRSAKVLLASLEVPRETIRRAVERAKQAGLITIINPAPVDRKFAHHFPLELIDILTPNEGEAATLTDMDTSSPAAAVEAARKLREKGVGSVIVTLGRDGSVVVTDEVTNISARPVQAVDATAAGDAFNGALAVRLAEGRGLVEAARWASRAAAISVTRLGAQPSLPSRQEIDEAAAND